MKVPVKIINRTNKLQQNYLLTLELGLIFSLSLSLVAVKMDIRESGTKKAITVSEQEEIFIEEVIQTKQEIRTPPPPMPTVPVEVPNDEIIEDVIIELNAELDLDGPVNMPPPPPEQKIEEVEDEIFIVVEHQPVLIGGIASVQERIVYPEIALKAGIEGRVVVQFVIDKEGNVVDPVVIRGIGAGCDEEALRAVKKAKFTPGLQRGRPVQVRYTLPITFRIKDSNS